MTWSARFEEPILLPLGGGELSILQDAGAYITNLPKATHSTKSWQDAMHILIQAADHGIPVEFARIGMMQALFPKGEPVYDPGRKDAHWGRKKLVRDR